MKRMDVRMRTKSELCARSPGGRPVLAASRVAAISLLAALCACGDSGNKTPKPTTDGAAASAGQGGPIEKLTATKDYSKPLVVSGLREQAIDCLLGAGRSRDASVRANATEAVLVAPSRLEPIVAASLKDDNLGVRSVAAVVVGKARLSTLAPALRPLLSDSSPFVQASVIFGLQRCGEAVDATPLSRFLLDDPSPKVRSHAAYLLGELGEASAAPMLRLAAKKSLPRASEAEVQLMQLQIAEALVKLGEEDQIKSIRAALYPSRPEDLEATALAVQIIGALKDQRSTNQLIYLSARQDNAGNLMPVEVRLGVASALAHMGNRRGNFIAEEFWNSENPVHRAQAASVFGATAQPDGLVYLDRLLTDPSEQVRTAAAAGVLKAIGTGSGG